MWSLFPRITGIGRCVKTTGQSSPDQASYRGIPTPPLPGGGNVRHTVAMGVASVLIVEDDTFSRTLIASTLAAHSLDVVGSTGQAAVGLELARLHTVDVALLDLDLGPGPTGFEVSVLLRREHPTIGIVFLTSYQDPRLLTGAPELVPPGSRFLQKSELTDSRVLVKAVLQAKASPCAVQPSRRPKKTELTPHQVHILRMVAEGLSSKDIAEQTGVSEKAVEGSISRIHRILATTDEPTGNKRVSLVRAFYALTGRTPPRG
jgi:DNA-binding NarL/FixJ family response regulator